MTRCRGSADARTHPGARPVRRAVNEEFAGRVPRSRVDLVHGAVAPPEIAYRVLDTPVGALLLAATGQGLLRVAYPAVGHTTSLDLLASVVSPRVRHLPARLDREARQLDEYFAGRRRRFDLPLDLRLARGFRRTVLVHLLAIAYGRTASYGAVAAAVGSPRAVRVVGTACATNPVPVVVPCHRVVRADGSSGGYVGGEEARRRLLALESARS